MPSIFQLDQLAMVGIKGVGMTALAQCLLDIGKTIWGFDDDLEYVTSQLLRQRQISLLNFASPLPENCQAVIYSTAYDPAQHPLLLKAKDQGLPLITLAEATAQLFNQQSGIAVCGVGGKSTVTAWLMWVLNQMNRPFSGVAGVGQIIGLNFTGIYRSEAEYFVAEADEYAQNPMAVKRGEVIKPRFSLLEPAMIIATNLKFDHPDVYRDFEQTLAVFLDFFGRLKPEGKLVYNGDDQALATLAQKLKTLRPDVKIFSFGQSTPVDFRLISSQTQLDDQVQIKNQLRCHTSGLDQPVNLTINLPGVYGAMNALAVWAAGQALGWPSEQINSAIATFHSTTRRFESKGKLRTNLLIDDYAHTPHELTSIITALKELVTGPVVVCFQPHTFSRTKAYLSEFAQSLASADQVILLPIFPSARETSDPTVASDQIAALLQKMGRTVTLAADFTQAADIIQNLNGQNGAIATLGAGDVYQIWDQIKNITPQK